MKIVGIEKCSFVDYPGRMAAVFFTPGCNWNCYYCHNRRLIGEQGPHPWWDVESALALLEDRRGFLDGAVITGGEPTLQTGLADFIAQVRSKGYRVKLDTNGTRPAVLASLIDAGLLDYVAMDLKAPIEKYEAIVGVPVDHSAINHSIDLLLASQVEYEFRTTVVPQLSETDVLAIAHRIRGARRYVLQQYRRPTCAGSDPRLESAPHAPDWTWNILEEIETLVDQCDTRGFDAPFKTAAFSADLNRDSHHLFWRSV